MYFLLRTLQAPCLPHTPTLPPRTWNWINLALTYLQYVREPFSNCPRLGLPFIMHSVLSHWGVSLHVVTHLISLNSFRPLVTQLFHGLPTRLTSIIVFLLHGIWNLHSQLTSWGITSPFWQSTHLECFSKSWARSVESNSRFESYMISSNSSPQHVQDTRESAW